MRERWGGGGRVDEHILDPSRSMCASRDRLSPNVARVLWSVLRRSSAASIRSSSTGARQVAVGHVVPVWPPQMCRSSDAGATCIAKLSAGCWRTRQWSPRYTHSQCFSQRPPGLQYLHVCMFAYFSYVHSCRVSCLHEEATGWRLIKTTFGTSVYVHQSHQCRCAG